MATLNAALSAMGGRLWAALRERPPFAYIANGAVTALKYGGAYVAYATTPPRQEDAAIEALLAEFERIRREGLGPDELARVKRYLAGTHVVALRRSAARAAAYAAAEMLGVGCGYVERLPRLIRAITNDDVARVAGRYFDTEDGVAVAVLRAVRT